MNPETLFYIQRDEAIAGPYDLVQVAGLLRRKIITPETMTRREGRDDWQPLSWQPQYSVIREMSPHAVSTRVDALDEEAGAAAAGPIMLPSRETMMKIISLLLGCVLAAGIAFVMAYLDRTMGYCLLVAGGAVILVAHCLIIARVLEEDGWTLLGMFFVPGYDIYYFVSNVWQYYPLFCLKYLGAAVSLGAVIGLATGHA